MSVIETVWVRGSGPTRALVAAVLACLVALAWANRFIQDDAFISFRYADNLVRGLGLVWNAGERVEGYSNFLWTLLIAGGMWCGADPVLFSQLLGIALYTVTLVTSFRLARLFLCSDGLALAALVLLATNHTFSSYATGGLETQLQTALVTIALYRTALAVHRRDLRRAECVRLGFLFTAAILTRLDSAIPCAVMGVYLAVHFRRNGSSIRERLALAASLVAPMLLVLGPWLVWKSLYYGTITPNSFYVKEPGLASIPRGLNYLYTFVVSYWLVALVPVLAFALGRIRHAQGSPLFSLLGPLIAFWLLYVVLLGGDFMEFRFLVPVLPAVFILVAWIIFVFVRRPALRAGLALLVVAGSVHHSMTFVYTPENGIEPTWHLDRHITSADEQWGGIGRALRDAFGPSSTVTIATTAAGAIPYYSHLRTIDMLGINDPWVARHGASFLPMAGHGRITTLEHLIDSKVNLVLSHPILVGGNAPVTLVSIPLGDVAAPWRERRVLRIPVDSRHTLIALYLSEHPAVDSVAAARGWTITRE